jgi:hypothetical protein
VIERGRDRGVVLGRAPQAVLRCEETDESSAGHVGEQRGGVTKPAVDRCLVGEETEAPSAEERRAALDHNLQTRPDPGHATDSSPRVVG